MESFSADQIRIDASQEQINAPRSRQRDARDVPQTTVSASAAQNAGKCMPAGEPLPPIDRHNWLALHADELITRLQTWADQLDAREAQLNAREALLENRERTARLRQQDTLNSQTEQRRSIARIRHELESQARRLAFTDPD